MRESLCIDSPFRGWAMPKSYSGDLRERVIEAVEAGASRREAGERFEISASSSGQMAAALTRERERRAEATRRKRFSAGRVCGAGIGSDCRTAGPDFGGDRCRAAQAADSNQPQFALAFSRPTRHHPQKKACKPRNGSEQMWSARADVGSESKACLIPPGWCLSTKRRSAPTWCGSGDGLRGASG